MNAIRFTQNFKNRRAIVVSRDFGALDALDQTLLKLGMSVSYVPLKGDLADLRCEELDTERDVLLVDGDLNGPLDLPVSPLSETTVVPIIGLVGIEAPSRLKGLLQLGATAILRKPVHGAIVYSALVLGVNTYHRKQQMEASIAMHEERRNQRRSLIKAIVEIMRIHGICDDEAYNWLRRESMKNRMSVEGYSEYFIAQMMKVDRGDPEPENRSMIVH